MKRYTLRLLIKTIFLRTDIMETNYITSTLYSINNSKYGTMDEFKKIMNIQRLYFTDSELSILFDKASKLTKEEFIQDDDVYEILERMAGKGLEYLKEKTISGISDNKEYVCYLIEETKHDIDSVLLNLPEFLLKEYNHKEGFVITNYVIEGQRLHLGLYNKNKDSYLTTVMFVLNLLERDLISYIYHDNEESCIDVIYKCSQETIEKEIKSWVYITADDYDWYEVDIILNKLEEKLILLMKYENDINIM